MRSIQPFKMASLSSGGKVTMAADRRSFTFDLADDADAVILR
jgi:hypothetical protein